MFFLFALPLSDLFLYLILHVFFAILMTKQPHIFSFTVNLVSIILLGCFNVNSHNFYSLCSFLLFIYHNFSIDGLHCLIWLFYQIWGLRNKIIFQNYSPNLPSSFRDLMFKFQRLWSDAYHCPTNLICFGWSRPPSGYVKFNVDASCQFLKCSFDVVVRDVETHFIEALCRSFQYSFSLLAEGHAIWMALLLSYSRVYQYVIIESDALEFIQLISASPSVWPWKARNLLQQINNIYDCGSSSGIAIQFTHRSANFAAHWFAKESLSGPSFQLLTSLPTSLV